MKLHIVIRTDYESDDFTKVKVFKDLKTTKKYLNKIGKKTGIDYFAEMVIDEKYYSDASGIDISYHTTNLEV